MATANAVTETVTNAPASDTDTGVAAGAGSLAGRLADVRDRLARLNEFFAGSGQCLKLAMVNEADDPADETDAGAADDETGEPDEDGDDDDEVSIDLAAVPMCVSVNGRDGTGTPGGEALVDVMVPDAQLGVFHRAIVELAVSLSDRLSGEQRRRVLGQSDNGNGQE